MEVVVKFIFISDSLVLELIVSLVAIKHDFLLKNRLKLVQGQGLSMFYLKINCCVV